MTRRCSGDYDEAVDRIEELRGPDIALRNQHLVLASVLGIDPLWDPLRDHPRFQALLDRDKN